MAVLHIYELYSLSVCLSLCNGLLYSSYSLQAVDSFVVFCVCFKFLKCNADVCYTIKEKLIM